jgi:archaellum biogenesis ATPase FlaH
MNITHESDMNRKKEKAELIKNALLIVDKLSKFEAYDYEDSRELEDLFEKAKKLTSNSLWKLH